ncbi:hypothetical protein ACINNAV18_3228 [Acinetobacter baumannii Naval-18]|nr:hypothetical protein ACINNAV18_3228 [Acinetobacter baumannii Naval-18]
MNVGVEDGVHGGIRHLERIALAKPIMPTVHGGIRHLERPINQTSQHN